MEVSNELIDKLAHLSRLQFDPEEKSRIQTDLQNMIGFIEKLNEADTEGVEPLLHITPNVNVLRDDAAAAPTAPGTFTQQAPGATENYFRVPKVIKK